jgi:hypothetical protein
MLAQGEIARMLLVLLLTAGPLLAVLLRLNARDRRRQELLGAVARDTPRELRQAVVVRARVGLLAGRRTVEVELRDADRDELWRAGARWRAGCRRTCGWS